MAAERKSAKGMTEDGRIRRSLRFQGTWRSYQARVLEQAGSYLKDGKIHIVAAPGSGKTTLGIELIARADAPCLILAPSITIREQWLSRIREGFGAAGELLSNDIRKPAPITAITYQGLHSCLKRLHSVEEDEDGTREEKDYTRFDLYAALKETGVRTFCLDEAHHLRSEWQKALEEVVGQCRDHTLISLTATPPYDSTPSQWNRYIGLCGPIDEEISVPELVKEGSLCPHQDYVYFNMPTPEEMEAVQKFRAASARVYKKLMADEQFAKAVMSHGSVKNPGPFWKLFEENRPYLTAMLAFWREKRGKAPKGLSELAGETELPLMDGGLLAALLQGFLFEDKESYFCEEGYQKDLAASLRVQGVIHKNRVELASSSQVDKLLINSRGKLISIQRIVEAEHNSLGEKLRLLILTDFIRSECLGAIGDETKPVQEMGVVPIFEFLRRGLGAKEPRLAALSGSVVILPESAGAAFRQMAEENGQKASLQECGAAGYYLADLSGGGPTATAYLTELFQKGEIRVLVGTKSLLGEGWDSPCINSLILASFVGSFMLSNQMRGRAIRTMYDNPDKVSNIWHLICMEPVRSQKENGEKSYRSQESGSADFATLRRRFEGFCGVSYEEDVIENGLDRLTFIRPPYGNRELQEINRKMTVLSADREGLKAQWERTLRGLVDMETADGVGLKGQNLRTESRRQECRKQVRMSGIGLAAAAAVTIGFALIGQLILCVASAAAAAAAFCKLRAGKRKEAVFTKPELFLDAVAAAVLAALQEIREISSDGVSVSVEKGGGQQESYCFACLTGGTEREKSMYADTLAEFFGEIGSQRYLAEVQVTGQGDRKCWPVPEIFGQNKESARIFVRHTAPCIGTCSLIFTRSEDGRKALLKAGIREQEEERVMRQKKVRNR